MPSTRTIMIEVAMERLEALRQAVQGEVFAPGDPGYDEARLAWNRVTDQYPALIIRAANAADVVEAVRFARAEGLPIAAQATGHGVVSPADGALLVLTERLTELAIDPETQMAWIGAGLKWGEVLARSQEHGLAPLLGSSPGVSAVGYTLGGGLGWLARKYGMAVDSVLRFEVVTADGRLIEASETKNSDLFWALRGGGGGFGIVTGMEIRLYPVSTVYGGDMLYPIEVAKEVYQRYRDWIASAPDELTTSIVTMNFPSLPQVPEFLRGKSGVILRGCYVGPLEQGEALVKYWLDWMPPIMSSFRAMPFLEVASISKDPEEPVPGVSSGSWLSDLDDETIDTILRFTLPQEGSSSLLVATEVRHTGGAIARVNADANALGHRDAPLALSIVALTPTPKQKERVEAYIAEFKQALAPHILGEFLNFIGKNEAPEHTVDAFSAEAYHRLQRVKAAYDPENFFRFAYPIPPAREA